MALVHRNALRLVKLVNTLLDFSRIEAGRMEASYEPVDLGALTAELASVFRSAAQRAGIELVVDCPPFAERAYVDREMWEKIAFNLLSNAFKFTFQGEIAVSLRQTDSAWEVTVRDTGTGVPAEELPRLFERFHRVKGARGRSHEGSGIGLALVLELAWISTARDGPNILGNRSYCTIRRERPCHHGTETPLSMSPEARTMGRWARRWNRTLTS